MGVLIYSQFSTLKKERTGKQNFIYAPLAQLVEQQTLNLMVGGSNPLWRTIYSDFRYKIKYLKSIFLLIFVILYEKISKLYSYFKEEPYENKNKFRQRRKEEINMKVLSLTEPYATLIKEGKKKVETRSWKTSY